MEDFDFGTTGAKETIRTTYISIASKEGKFVRDKAVIGSAFSGRITNFDARYVEEPKNKDIPPHWEFKLFLDARDNDGEVKNFAISFCSHWQNPVCVTLFNALLGAINDPNWNKGVQISLWTVETDSGRPSCRASFRYLNQNNNSFLPYRFAWNQSLSKYENLPEPRSLGIYEGPTWNDSQKAIFPMMDEIIAHFNPGSASKVTHIQSSQNQAKPAETAGKFTQSVQSSQNQAKPSGNAEESSAHGLAYFQKQAKAANSPEQIAEEARKVGTIFLQKGYGIPETTKFLAKLKAEGKSLGMADGELMIKDNSVVFVPVKEEFNDLPF